MNVLNVVLPLVIAYLLGGIPFGLLIARLYGIKDIRREGSGNIGATNVWRVAGGKAAIWVYLLDIGKGVAAIVIARQFEPALIDKDLLLVLTVLAVVLGSIFSIYLGFKGGKGVNTSLGAMITLLPIESLIALGVFILVVLITRFISLGSITASTALVMTVLIEKYVMNYPLALVYVLLTVALALMVVMAHRTNIKRLLTGTESRFSLGSKANRPKENA